MEVWNVMIKNLKQKVTSEKTTSWITFQKSLKC